MVVVLKKGATKKEMADVVAKLPGSKGVDTKKFCGVIKLNEDSLVIQKKMRDEWN